VEERAQARATFEAVVRGDKPGRHIHTLVTRTRERRIVQWWDTVLLSSERELQAVLCVGHDITSQKETERALRRSEDHAREMEELASMSTLAAGLAHDIGTPMNIILGYAGMLEETLQNERDRRRARIICEQVERVRNLMQTLMNLAQPSPDTRSPVELGPLLARTLDLLQDRLHKHGIRVIANLDAAASILGNPERLERAFLNLVVNAVDAMPSGGTLCLSLAPRQSSGDIQIEISDSGVGMSEDVRQHIFEPFFTTKPLSSEHGSGNGLGLMVTRSVILDHRGSIDVESEPQQGTRFVVTFPNSDAPATKPDA